jgi:hypothetical protein
VIYIAGYQRFLPGNLRADRTGLALPALSNTRSGDESRP